MSAAIVRGCDAHMPHEGAPEGVDVREAAERRDPLGRVPAMLQRPAGRRDPRNLDLMTRCHPDLMMKQPREMTRTEAGPCREARNAVVDRRLGRNPPLNLLQDRAARGRRLELAAKSELTTRPLEEHHELRSRRGKLTQS